MTAAHRRMAARRSSPCKLLIIVLYANREHRRDAYATLGSATCLTPWPPTVQRPAATLPRPGQRGLLLVGKPRFARTIPSRNQDATSPRSGNRSRRPGKHRRDAYATLG